MAVCSCTRLVFWSVIPMYDDRGAEKRYKRYDLSSYSHNIPYYILTWYEILADWMSGIILSWYMRYLFGCVKNICLYSKPAWRIKLNKNNLWSCQESRFCMFCSILGCIQIPFLSTKSALFSYISQSALDPGWTSVLSFLQLFTCFNPAYAHLLVLFYSQTFGQNCDRWHSKTRRYTRKGGLKSQSLPVRVQNTVML